MENMYNKLKECYPSGLVGRLEGYEPCQVSNKTSPERDQSQASKAAGKIYDNINNKVYGKYCYHKKIEELWH